MIQPIIRIGTTFLKKICRIDLLKTVLVITIIANIHITSPYDLCISSSFPLFFPYILKKKIASPTQFGKISFPPLKKGVGLRGAGQRTMCIHLRIYLIFYSFCVLLLKHFVFFEYYYSCLTCLIQLFANSELPFS